MLIVGILIVLAFAVQCDNSAADGPNADAVARPKVAEAHPEDNVRVDVLTANQATSSANAQGMLSGLDAAIRDVGQRPAPQPVQTQIAGGFNTTPNGIQNTGAVMAFIQGAGDASYVAGAVQQAVGQAARQNAMAFVDGYAAAAQAAGNQAVTVAAANEAQAAVTANARTTRFARMSLGAR